MEIFLKIGKVQITIKVLTKINQTDYLLKKLKNFKEQFLIYIF